MARASVAAAAWRTYMYIYTNTYSYTHTHIPERLGCVNKFCDAAGMARANLCMFLAGNLNYSEYSRIKKNKKKKKELLLAIELWVNKIRDGELLEGIV